MARPRQQKHTQAEIAAMVGVSVKSLREWVKTEGLDLADIEAVKRRAGTVTSKDETLADARRRKAVASADAEEIRVRRMKGELVETRIPRGVITQLDHAVGIIWKQTPNELVSILDGLGGAKMRAEIIKYVDHTLIPRFANQLSAGIAEIDASFSELRKILPSQNP